MLVLYVVSLGVGGSLLLASLILGSKDQGASGEAPLDTDASDLDHDLDQELDHELDHDIDHGEASPEDVDDSATDADHAGGHGDSSLSTQGGGAIHAGVSVHSVESASQSLVVGSPAHLHHDHEHWAEDALVAWLPLTSLRFWTFFSTFFGLTGVLLKVLDASLGTAIDGVLAAAVGYASGVSVLAIGRQLDRRSTDSSIGETDYVGSTAVVMLGVRGGHPGKVRLEMKGRTVELIAETEEEDEFRPKDLVMIYQMTDDGRAWVTKAEGRDSRAEADER